MKKKVPFFKKRSYIFHASISFTFQDFREGIDYWCHAEQMMISFYEGLVSLIQDIHFLEQNIPHNEIKKNEKKLQILQSRNALEK